MALALLAVILLATSSILTQEIIHDEHMYLSAAKLTERLEMYRDFAYLQSPYMPFVYRVAAELSEGKPLLLSARITKSVVTALLILALFQLAFLLSSDRWVALACVLLVWANDIFLFNIGYARNYDLPMLLVLLAGWLVLSPLAGRAPHLSHASAGLLVGLAVGTKLTYALTPLSFGALIVFGLGPTRRSFARLASFSLGVGLALLPALFLALDAGIDRAWFNNLGYHTLNTTWRAQTGYTEAMSTAGKLRFAAHTLWTAPSVALLFLALATVGAGIRERRSIRFPVRSAPALWCCALVLIALLMALGPTPSWKGYYAPLVVFTALLCAALYPRISSAGQKFAKLVALACALTISVFQVPSHALVVRSLTQPDQWDCLVIHRAGSALRQAIPPQHRARPVATLGPIYALEGGLAIYPELATGPFTYRVGHLLSSEQIQRFRVTSSRQIDDLLSRNPPSAILTGLEGELDAPLDAFATRHSYEKRDGLIEGVNLYLLREGPVQGTHDERPRSGSQR